MSNDLKQTEGYAHNRIWYSDERHAMMAQMSAEDDQPIYNAVLYGDGSVIVMDDHNVVIDRFVDQDTADRPTQYEVK